MVIVVIVAAIVAAAIYALLNLRACGGKGEWAKTVSFSVAVLIIGLLVLLVISPLLGVGMVLFLVGAVLVLTTADKEQRPGVSQVIGGILFLIGLIILSGGINSVLF